MLGFDNVKDSRGGCSYESVAVLNDNMCFEGSGIWRSVSWRVYGSTHAGRVGDVFKVAKCCEMAPGVHDLELLTIKGYHP